MAHVVLKSAPPDSHPRSREKIEADDPVIVPLSARSLPALRDVARRYAQMLETNQPVSVADIACTAAHRYTHHAKRLALVVHSSEELKVKLEQFLAGPPNNQTVVLPGSRTVFVFSGHGSQWPEMGRALMSSSPVFREAMEAYDRRLREEAGWSAIDLLAAGAVDAGSFLSVQPLLVGVMIALQAV